MGLVDEIVHHRLHARLHAKRGQFEAPRLLVEQAQHDALAVAGGHGGHAHVHGTAGDPEADAAVLGQALLGDVEARHHLDARYQQRRHRALRLQNLAQHAVHAEPHAEAVLVGLDVDVGGVFLDGLGQHRVDETDDRRIVLALEQVGRLGKPLGQAGEVGLTLDALDNGARLAAAALVGLGEQLVEGGRRGALDDEGQAGEAPQLRHRGGRGALAIDDVRLAVDDRADEDPVALRKDERQPGLQGGRTRCVDDGVQGVTPGEPPAAPPRLPAPAVPGAARGRAIPGCPARRCVPAAWARPGRVWAAQAGSRRASG